MKNKIYNYSSNRLKIKKILFLISFFLNIILFDLNSNASINSMTPIGVGISHPSETSVFFRENPAGLGLLKNAKFQISGSQSSGSPSQSLIGGALFFGGQWGAISIGALQPNDGVSSTKEEAVGYIGLGTYFSSIDMAMGINSEIVKSSSSKTVHEENLGILFNPLGKIQFGVTAYNFLDNGKSYGLGIGFRPSNTWSFSFDLISDTDLKTKDYWVGLKHKEQSLELGGGFHFDDQENSKTDGDDLFLSLGLQFGNSFSFQFYYQIVQKYYAGIQIDF